MKDSNLQVQSDSILTFDPDENKWKEDEYPRMPCKLDGLQVCNLHFPEYILDEVRRCNWWHLSPFKKAKQNPFVTK